MHDEALRVLPELLETLKVNDPVLVGHSDGASIALVHAGARVRSVRGLVLLAPHVFVEECSVASIMKAHDAFTTGDLRDRLWRHHGDNTDGAFYGWADVWLDPAFREWNIEEYLPAVRSPVLVIQGDDDEYGTRRQLDTIGAQVEGDVETMLLPRCGHRPHWDHRDFVVEAVSAFVSRT